jgi:hypothetical protein
MKRILLISLSFVAGVLVSPWLQQRLDYMVRGRPQLMIATDDFALSYSGDAARKNVVVCPGAARGGVKKGTPLVVRRHGAVLDVSLRLLTADSVPLREASLEETGRGDATLLCAFPADGRSGRQR